MTFGVTFALPVKKDRLVCWQLMLLDLLKLNRAVGEALSGKLSGKYVPSRLGQLSLPSLRGK